MGYLGFLSKTCCLFVPDIRIGAFQCILPSIFIWGQPLSKTFEPVYLWQKDWHCWHKNCWFKKSDAGGWVVINLILYSCVAIKIPCHYQDGERVPLNTFTHIVNQQYIMQNKVTGKGVLKNALFSSTCWMLGHKSANICISKKQQEHTMLQLQPKIWKILVLLPRREVSIHT